MEGLCKFYKPCLRLSVILLLFTIISFAFFSRKMLGAKSRVCVKRVTMEPEEQLQNLTFFETYENEITYRKEITEKICKTYPEFTSAEKDFKSLFWQNNSHLVYCYHPKAGGSTWLKILFELSKEKFTSEDQAHHVAEDLFVREGKDLDFKDSLLINVIQDPFSRFIEGYREKMRDPGAGILKEKILQLRTFINNTDTWKKLLSDEGFDATTEPTPEEYLNYVVTQIEICDSDTAPEGCWGLLGSLWKPYHMECSPCAFKYDVISKIETFDNDLKYIRKRVEKLLKKNQSILWKNLTTDFQFVLDTLKRAKDDEGQKRRTSTNDYAREVWRLLTENDQQRFRRAYRFDYLMFDYNPFEFE